MELQTVEVVDAVDLSLNSVKGLSFLGMLKMKGLIERREVIVLIDCGATPTLLHREQ